MNYTVRFSVDQHIGDRDNQEDAMRISSMDNMESRGLLAVLSDGMGGLKNGEKFSAIATEEMISCFETQAPDSDMCQQLISCFAYAQKKALAIQPIVEEERGGATVLAILIRNDQCAFLSSGDSRIYLIRGEKIIQLTRDQELGIKLDERAAFGFLPMEQVKRSRGRGALVGFFGTTAGIYPDVCSKPFRIGKGDRIILASDGIFDTINEKTILRVAQGEITSAAKDMIQTVLNTGKPNQDNCSVMIFCIEDVEQDAGLQGEDDKDE